MDASRPPERSDIFHSTAFGRAASRGGVGVGAVDMTSFRDRRHIERNRQNVQRYASSMIGMAHTRETFKDNLGATPTSTGGALAARRQNLSRTRGVGSALASGSAATPRPSFREPPARYNPYG